VTVIVTKNAIAITEMKTEKNKMTDPREAESDLPLRVRVETLLDGRSVREMSVMLSTGDQLVQAFLETPTQGEMLGMESARDFSAIPSVVRRFVREFRAYQQNLISREGRGTMLIGAPFDLPFLEKLFAFRPVILVDGEEYTVTLSEDEWPLRFHWDGAASSLLAAGYPRQLLISCLSGHLLIDGHRVHPLPYYLSRELLEACFAEGAARLDGDSRSRLFLASLHNPRLADFVNGLPEVQPFRDENIVLSFGDEGDSKIRVEAYFEEAGEGKSRQYPFLFEEIRKNLLLSEELVVPLTADRVFVAQPGSPFYEKVRKVSQSARECFFEFLNEINGNSITPHDSESLFQKFFPAVVGAAEVRRGLQELRLISGDVEEKLVELRASDPDKHPEKIDWLEVRFRYRIRNVVLTLTDLRKILRDGYIHHGDAIVTLSKQEMEDLSGLFQGLPSKEKDGKEFISRFHLPFLFRQHLSLSLPDSLRPLAEELDDVSGNRKNLRSMPIPEPINSVLRDYQRTGVYWLHFLHRYGFGGILADEMGLGKTVQVLAFLRSIRGSGTSLIVCPTALVYNWVGEIQKFLGLELTYIVIDGEKPERLKRIREVGSYDLVITSYPLLHNDIEEFQRFEFCCCILDEAQHIKNKHAKRTLSVKGINARQRIAMTGTPVENNVWELWSIFDFLMPDFLGAPGWFRKHVEVPLTGFDKNARSVALASLKAAIRPFVLRRIKSTVLKELPPKIEQNITLELTEKQKAVYLSTLSNLREGYLNAVKSKGVENTWIDFLAVLTRLRQICLHPGLMNEEMLSMDDVSIKLKALMELLEEAMDSGHRVVVFSQFVEMLRIVRRELQKEEIEYLYIDGTTKERVDLVNRFNASDIPVFLISLKAGGTGLNLVGADSVILFDPWWNPAVEDQAIDRVHRIGQMNTVNVYRLITRGTIEEKIRQLQAKKKEVFDSLVVQNEGFIKKMEWDDIRSLLEME